MPQFGDRTALGPGGEHVPGRSDRHGPDEPPNAHRSRIARRWRQRVAAQNFQGQDFGKLYRSCGNCSSQFKRAVSIQNVTVTAPGKTLAGVNANYGDTATLSGITIIGDASKKISICDRYQGNNSGGEPTKLGTGADGTVCRYTPADVAYR